MSLAISGVLGLTPIGARILAAVATPLGGGWVWQVVLYGSMRIAPRIWWAIAGYLLAGWTPRDPVTFIEMQRRLGVVNIADLEPNRLYDWAFASHPSTIERIATARDWAQINRLDTP